MADTLAQQLRKTRSELDLALDFFARHDSDPQRSDREQYQFDRLHQARAIITQEIHRADTAATAICYECGGH